jgi:exodeoxyribonuclease V gamma subunit
MGIHLNASNSLRPLVQKLARDLKYEGQDAFIPQWIITQTEGMNNWLRIELAQQLGIASNIRFQKPNDVLSRIYYQVEREHKVLDTETVRWCIYSILGTNEFQSKFPDITSYCISNDIRRVAFAGELADIFDQYQVYRFETIGTWDRLMTDGHEADDWQNWMWCAIKRMLGPEYKDKTELSDLILEKIKSPEVKEHIARKMPKLHLFGIAVITPYYLRIFHEMSAFIDIHFYLVNPAPEDYWLGDKSEKQIARLRGRTIPDHVRAGNDLLLNWGRIIRESFELLFQNEAYINQYDAALVGAKEVPTTLLGKLQHDIYHNANKEGRNKVVEENLKDGSITINGCFTPVREVETLYNYLVELVDNSQDKLSARDMLVLVTDIDLYAPYIKAVFNNALYRFPFTIADETITVDNNMFSALREILLLDARYFKSEDVLKLLESPYIRSRFQIRDVDLLRTAIRQAGIYFSMEGRTVDDTRYISWGYGLKKILFGICMSGEEDYNDGMEVLTPLDTEEGSSALERVKLIHFINILKDKIYKREKARTISGWAQYLGELMEDMVFQAGEKEDDDYAKFVQIIEKMTVLDEAIDQELSFEVFRHSFLKLLETENRSGSFTGAGITFCSMVPMRSIPFKVVAMLGMDFDKFPRKETPVSFSILSETRLPGDRNIKDNDKHLFLETILSAEKRLYISYIARDAKDGSVLPPSSLVDECIDYVARGLREDTDNLRKRWITVHPLHGFSKKYFEQGGLRNYLAENRYLTQISVAKKDEPQLKELHFSEIDVNKLAQFFQNPPKAFINKQLDVYFNDDEILLPDHEVFELNVLEKSIIQNELIMTDKEALDDFVSRKSRTGSIPLKNMAIASVRAAFDEMVDLKRQVHAEIAGIEASSVEIRLKINDSALTGVVESIYGSKFITICNSSKRLKALVSGYIKYLAIIAAGEKMDFVFISKKSESPARIVDGTISSSVALKRLQSFVENYKEGHSKYFYFWPAAALDTFSLINGSWKEFHDKYEDMLDNERDYNFKDDYLSKAVEYEYFSEKNYEELKANVLSIMGPICDLLPQLFEKD